MTRLKGVLLYHRNQGDLCLALIQVIIMHSEVNQSSEIKSQVDLNIKEVEENNSLKNESPEEIKTSEESVQSPDLDTRPISPLMALSLKIGEV